MILSRDEQALADYAEANYENGGDNFVECYDQADYALLLSENGTVAKAKAIMDMLMEHSMDERGAVEADIQSFGDYGNMDNFAPCSFGTNGN